MCQAPTRHRAVARKVRGKAPLPVPAFPLRDYALEAGVIDRNFISNLTDSVFGWTVRADLLEGLELGVREVPAIFINGERFTGLPNLAQLSKAVEAELAKTKQKRA